MLLVRRSDICHDSKIEYEEVCEMCIRDSLMAEYMGVPYATVAVKAILPAVLYFAGVYIAVHLDCLLYTSRCV